MVESETSINYAKLRKDIRDKLASVAEGLRQSPTERWLPVTYSNLERLDKAARGYPRELQTYFHEQIGIAKKMLVKEFTCRNTDIPIKAGQEDIAHTTESIIYELSRQMALPFCEKAPNPISHNILPIPEMVAQRPDFLHLREESIAGCIHRFMDVINPNTGKISTLRLPDTDYVLYKGGVSRLMLNLVAGAPKSMIDSEIPWNDLDAIGIGDSNTTRDEACSLGVDPEGIEMLGRNLDWDEYCLGRDTDHNQALLGRDSLHYSNEAYLAAQTGHITLNGLYMPNRALYGTDTFKYDEVDLGTPRGLMRLIKPLAEGKTMSFAYHPANRHVDCAPYFLFLARKWSRKPDFPILLQRGLQIGRLMGQVPDGSFDTYSILDRMHARVPLFDLEAEMRDPRDVAVWKGSKIIRQVDRELTWKFKFPGDLEISSEDINFEPITITLEGFVPDPTISKDIIDHWQDFKNKCAERVQETKSMDIDPADRYFLRNQAWLRFQH